MTAHGNISPCRYTDTSQIKYMPALGPAWCTYQTIASERKQDIIKPLYRGDDKQGSQAAITKGRKKSQNKNITLNRKQSQKRNRLYGASVVVHIISNL